VGTAAQEVIRDGAIVHRTCGQPVLRAKTITGDKVLLDAEPVPYGIFVLEDVKTGWPIAHARPSDGVDRFNSHFGACRAATIAAPRKQKR
jgi:hypothetical protein